MLLILRRHAMWALFALCFAPAASLAQSGSTCNGSVSMNQSGGGSGSCPGDYYIQKNFSVQGSTKCNNEGVGQMHTISPGTSLSGGPMEPVVAQAFSVA
jgi:hypothetical protein